MTTVKKQLNNKMNNGDLEVVNKRQTIRCLSKGYDQFNCHIIVN